MKATLFIKNIGKAYLCTDANAILENSWIACHHSKIIEVGCGKYSHLIDEDTRFIDVQGGVVIPGFVDPYFQMPAYTGVLFPVLEDTLYAMKQNGILQLASPVLEWCKQSIDQKVYYRKNIQNLSLIGLDFSTENLPENWLMTCRCQDPSILVYSLQPVMARLYYERGIDPLTLLYKATAKAAQVVGLPQIGSIQEGFEATFLILRINQFEEYLKVFGKPLIQRMVFQGIPVFPVKIRC